MPSKFAYELSNYVIIRSKVTLNKSEFKLYNYNEILKCTNIKYKIIVSIIINKLFMLLFI